MKTTGTLEEASYYGEVERHFVAARGSPLFITPREWQLVASWEQAGIPCDVVLEAIDRLFERPKTRLRRRTLAYCRQSVEAAFKRYKEARLGSSSSSGAAGDEAIDPGSAAREQLTRLVTELEGAAGGQGASSHALAEALRATARELEALAGSVASTRKLSAIEPRLAELDAALVEALERGVGEEAKRKLEKEAEQTLASYRERMPAPVHTAAVRSAFLRRLRARFGLSRLSLF